MNQEINLFIEALEEEFKRNINTLRAEQQKAYMKGKFEYYGMIASERREVQKPFLVKAYLPPKAMLESYVKTLWAKPHRDFHYVAQELAFKYIKQTEPQDIELYQYMISHQSWWDTVDYIAPKLVGNYFKQYPESRKPYIDLWLASNNIWLQRSALLFQLKYKEEMDLELLSYVIESLLGSKEFFINKAIGWVLREHSRINPEWVMEFVDTHELSNLSQREAMRLITG